MHDKRRHRGPAPQDADLFSDDALPALQCAARDLAWLLDRGYPRKSTLQLVGDRYELVARQRTAVSRTLCSESERLGRAGKCLASKAVAGQTLHLDGYNVLTTIEVAMAGGVLLRCRDETIRDMASMHGTWRQVEETEKAIRLLGQMYTDLRSDRWTWLLDRPVANSGRLAALIRRIAEEQQWDWLIETPDDADRVLIQLDTPIATADSNVLDHCTAWHNLAAATIRQYFAEVRVLDMFSPGV